MKNVLLSCCVAILAACGAPKKAGSDGGASSDGGAPCGPGTLTATVQPPGGGAAVSVTYQCFIAQNLPADPTVQLHLWNSSGSGWNGGVPELDFKFAKSCTFQSGQVVQLSSPCLQILDQNNDQELGSNVLGLENGCTVASCTGAASASLVTQGSVTLDQWSTATGATVQMTFSKDAALTGVTTNPAFPQSASSEYVGFSVPLAGTAIATVESGG